MQVSFSLIGAKAFSVNKMSSRDQRFKTPEFKDWHLRTKTLIYELDEYKRLLEMASDHDKLGGTFSISIEVVYPHWFYYNKQGDISAKTFDCSNIEKPLIDLIFGDVICINDRYITHMSSTKRAGANYAVNVSLKFYAKSGS